MASYPTFVALGFMVGVMWGLHLAKQRGIDRTYVIDIGLVGLVSGLLGAHVFYYAEFYHEHFAHRPWHAILAVWEGGLVFYGGVIGGVVAGVLYVLVRNAREVRRGNQPVALLAMADIAACVLPIGLAFGRMGCYLNGCCWGGVVDADHALASIQFPAQSYCWERQLDAGLIAADSAFSLPVHPTQPYAIAGALAIAVIVWLYWRRDPANGAVTAALMALYGPWRFFLESIRTHDTTAEMTLLPVLGLVTYSQLVSLGISAAGLLLGIAVAVRGGLCRSTNTATTKLQKG